MFQRYTSNTATSPLHGTQALDVPLAIGIMPASGASTPGASGSAVALAISHPAPGRVQNKRTGRSQRLDSTSDFTGESTRVLIPIDATERSRWAIRRVLAEHRSGRAMEVHLLFIAEPVTDWQVLRFRTQAEIAVFHANRAKWLLEDAAQPLRAAGIAVQTHFREGDIAFEILDTGTTRLCPRRPAGAATAVVQPVRAGHRARGTAPREVAACRDRGRSR